MKRIMSDAAPHVLSIVMEKTGEGPAGGKLDRGERAHLAYMIMNMMECRQAGQEAEAGRWQGRVFRSLTRRGMTPGAVMDCFGDGSIVDVVDTIALHPDLKGL